jgi:hypothetical protein
LRGTGFERKTLWKKRFAAALSRRFGALGVLIY